MDVSQIRNLAAILAVVSISLVAAACGGGTAPGVASITTSTAARGAGSSVASSRNTALLLAGRCLRQHGIPNMPDPAIATVGPAKGQPILSKQFLRNIPAAVVQGALQACHSELEHAGIDVGSNSSSTPTAQQLRNLLAFARCVRRHGFPSFPDPNGQGQLNLAGTGIQPHALTPSQLAAARACLSVAHGAVSIPVQNGATGNS